jgi:hypothetical protein
MSLLHTLTKDLALRMLAREGIAAIWQLNQHPPRIPYSATAAPNREIGIPEG